MKGWGGRRGGKWGRIRMSKTYDWAYTIGLGKSDNVRMMAIG